MTKQDDATAAQASIEDVAACAARADAQVKAVLGGVMAQRRSVEVAFAYAAALSPGVRANCWGLAEAARHEGWGRMQALLRSYAWDWRGLRAELAGLAAAWLPDRDGDLAGPGIAIDETAQLKKGGAVVILSFPAYHRSDLRDRVEDGDLDAVAAVLGSSVARARSLSEGDLVNGQYGGSRPGLLAWRCSPGRRATCRRSWVMSARSWVHSPGSRRCSEWAASSRRSSEASEARWLAGIGAAVDRLVASRSCRIWSRMPGWEYSQDRDTAALPATTAKVDGAHRKSPVLLGESPRLTELYITRLVMCSHGLCRRVVVAS